MNDYWVRKLNVRCLPGVQFYTFIFNNRDTISWAEIVSTQPIKQKFSGFLLFTQCDGDVLMMSLLSSFSWKQRKWLSQWKTCLRVHWMCTGRRPPSTGRRCSCSWRARRSVPWRWLSSTHRSNWSKSGLRNLRHRLWLFWWLQLARRQLF